MVLTLKVERGPIVKECRVPLQTKRQSAGSSLEPPAGCLGLLNPVSEAVLDFGFSKQ